jgi:hypothetical protein
MFAIKQLIILITLCVSFFTAHAQLVENFSDGELSQNPTWTGDTDEFLVDASFLLQSNGDTTSNSNREIYIATPSTALANAQWEFFVNPKVATSSNNRMDVFLTSNSDILTGDNQGYFVRIGGTPDEVALFRKDGAGVENYVITGVTGSINSSSTNPTKIKVTRDVNGLWSLYADYEGSGLLYNLVGTASDLTYTSSTHFGLVVRYSNSNRQKYYMDNISVGEIVVDTQAPTVLQVNVLGQQELEVVFSEIVEQTTAEEELNYTANGGLNQPTTAIRNASLFQRVNLQFADTFVSGQTYTLSISNVSDLAGNSMATAELSFLFYRPQPYDIVINEIMADPTPVVQQPDAEWFELFNRTPYPINLQNWFVKVNSTLRQITNAATILPDSFLVLTNLAGFEELYASAAVAEVESFPALTNSGASISLLNPDTVLISSVTYSDQWYNDAVKYEGGWSLEQISPLKPCEGSGNWSASNHPSGATPGRRNSIYQNISDESLPEVERVVLLSPDTIRVFFSETIPAAASTNPAAYLIDNGIGNPTSVTTYPPDFRSVKLGLIAPILGGVIYTLTASTPLSDCAGNSINADITAQFAIPEVIFPGDIVINEVLSNPKDEGVDFVEIFNRSAKILDLRELYISNQDTVSQELEGLTQIAPDGFLLFPGTYMVLSEDIDVVKSQYQTENEKSFLKMDDFPSFNNDDGVVVLSKQSDTNFVDRMIYTIDMHYTLLNSTDGVSLERINFDRPALDKSNWNSAASTVGFATPGYRNSQFAELSETQEGDLVIGPEVFSPDNDGFDDVTTLNYSFSKPGFTGDLSVYDVKGRLVKQLAKSAYFGSSGAIGWNGLNESGLKADIGIYIVVLEAFHLDGSTVKLKKPCVVAGKL